MTAIVAAWPRALAGLLAALALTAAPPLCAGLLTTERTVANFSFKHGTVDYRPEPGQLDLVGGDASALSTRLSGLARRADNALDPLSGALHLDDKHDDFGDISRIDFDLFGSLQSAESLPSGELLSASVETLGKDSKGGGFYRLIDQKPIAGTLASQYRAAGIFMLVAGVDDATWVAGYKDAASTNQLLDLEDAVANGTAPPGTVLPVPLPGGLWLLAAGLPWLIGRRRHPRSAPMPLAPLARA
jgi:hypothetical protein